MPLLLAIGGVVAAAGALGGYVAAGGVKGASDGIKYAAVGAAVLVFARLKKWI